MEWPQEILSGQYEFSTRRTGVGPALGWITDMVTDSLIEPDDKDHLEVRIGGRRFMTVRRNPPCGVAASGPVITLRQLVLLDRRPPVRGLNPLLIPGRPLRDRYREMCANWRAEWARLNPPKVPVWDVVDESLGRVIGRLHGGGPRTTIFDAAARPAAVMETNGSSRTFLAGGRPVAHIHWVPGTRPPDHRADVTGAAAGGLDPRLVLACGIRDFAHLSDT